MSDLKIGKTVAVLLAATLMIFSALTIGFSTTGTAFQRQDLMDNGPPGDHPGPGDGDGHGPPEDIIPDPGQMKRKIGSFMGDKKGSFVSFETDDDGIKNHELAFVENLTLFKEISIENLTVLEEEGHGPRYGLEGNGAEMQIFDNPSALIKIEVSPLGSPRNITFRLGNMTVEETAPQRIKFGFENYNRSASLTSIDPGKTRDFNRKVKKGNVNYTLKEETTFLFNIESGEIEDANSISNDISNAIADGKIGGELRVESSDGKVKHMSVSYRDVRMVAQMENERALEMMVSSETLGEAGTVLTIDISSSVMDIETAKDMNLKFDGEKASLADDFSDLESSEDPAYLVMVGEESTQLLVKVPEFSTHSITVEYLQGVTQEYLGALTYYLPSAALSAGLVLFGMLYPRDHGKKSGSDEEDDQEEKKKKEMVAIGANPENYNRNEENEDKIKGEEEGDEGETSIERY